MTISMVVFVSLQLYWIKELFGALNQDFSNKVYSALVSTTDKVSQIEIDKYYAKYKNFDKTVIANSKQPSLTTIQQVEDSASKRMITYSKNYIEKQVIPISRKGDSLNLTKMYTDEATIRIKKNENSPEALTTEENTSLENGEFNLREFIYFLLDNYYPKVGWRWIGANHLIYYNIL